MLTFGSVGRVRAVLAVLCVVLVTPALAIDFVHEVVPILRTHCVKCHGGDEAKGGFSLNTRKLFLEGDAAEPGNSKDSHFLELIASADLDMQMPPKDLARVPADQRRVLARWVNEGLPWTSGFSFRQNSYVPPLLPRQVDLPGPAGLNPIDQILVQHFKQNGQAPSASVDDSTFLRRASLDLVGLLPTPEQRQSFLASVSAKKREELVNDLLARDVDYTEHWLTFWNDLLRNDYTGTGFITGGRKQISKWLYRALIDNKPYDQFARELISPPDNESRGFIDGIKWRGTVSAGQTVEIQFAQSIAQSFLGINLKCASCHDSFIDQWKLSDAYSLAAVYATQPLDIHRCDKPTGEVAAPAWLFPELGEIDAALPPAQRLEQLSGLMTDKRNGRFARTIVNRLWAQLMGRGIVHPLDAMHTEPWNEDLLDHLANHLVDSGYDLKSVLRLIATSEVYGARSEALNGDAASGDDAFVGRRAHRMTAEQFMDAVWQLTGSAPSKVDAPVVRGKVDRQEVGQRDLQAEWVWGQSQADGKPAPAGEELVFRAELRIPSAIKTGVAVLSADNAFDLYINQRKV
ncbi:PSD1 and planctomycete cytochrome C domain-containing protein, partial [Rhodopirellula sp.]|nr:PSD1 and planctomycete cytochrome C domain-containing protein [Rhodopirellula sp.]